MNEDNPDLKYLKLRQGLARIVSMCAVSKYLYYDGVVLSVQATAEDCDFLTSCNIPFTYEYEYPFDVKVPCRVIYFDTTHVFLRIVSLTQNFNRHDTLSKKVVSRQEARKTQKAGIYSRR